MWPLAVGSDVDLGKMGVAILSLFQPMLVDHVLLGNQEFIDSYLQPVFLSQNILHLLYFLDAQGKVVWGVIHDTDFATTLQFPELIRNRLPSLHPLRQNLDNPLVVRGIQETVKGPMLISSHPVTTGDGINNPAGTLIMGRFLDDNIMQKISSPVGMAVGLFSLQSRDVPNDVAAVFLTEDHPRIYNVFSDFNETFFSYAPVPDIMGAHQYLLRAEIPRHISIAGSKNLHLALVLIFLAGFVILLTLLVVLQRIIIRPLQLLTTYTLQVVDEKGLVKVALPSELRDDEIGILTKEIAKMLRRIQQLYTDQERLVATRTEDFSQSNKLLQREVEGHRQTQKQLQQSNDELEIIFQNTQAGILVLKGGRKVSRVNQQFCKIMGYDKPADVIGRSVRNFHLSDLRFSEFGEKYYKKLSEGRKSQIEYPLKRKDGSVIWCLLSGNTLDPSTGKDPDEGTIWIVDDITDRKEAERRLEDLALLQGVMSTVGAVCHEIAQPIQVIDNQLQMLQSGAAQTVPMVERLGVIRKENARLANTTRKLRKISKYETMDYVSGIKILDIEKSASVK